MSVRKIGPALLAAVVLLWGCAGVPVEPVPVTPTRELVTDGCATALGFVGRATCAMLLGLAPGATELLDGIDAGRTRTAERLGAARERRAAADLERRRMEFCIANPDYGPCAGIVERALGLSLSGSVVTPTHTVADDGGGTDEAGAAQIVRLKARLRQEEGTVYTVTRGHICTGHNLAANKDAQEYAGRTMTDAECDALLETDIRAARERAQRNVSCTTDGCVVACFWRGCNDMDMGVLRGELVGIDHDRARSLLREIPEN